MSSYYKSHRASCYSNYPLYQSPQRISLNYESNNNFKQNNKLLNELTTVQTQKNFYRHKLTEQFHSHHSELETAFSTISEKNSFIINLEEQLDRLNKDYRILSDQYVQLKNKNTQQKQQHIRLIKIKDYENQQKIKKIHQSSQQHLNNTINKRVSQIQQQCDKRVQTFKKHLQQARAHSTSIQNQLTMLQQDYRQILLKNDTIIQESIQRELRKRDFEAQNNYLRDVGQYQHLKKLLADQKQTTQTLRKQIQSLTQQNKRLNSTNLIFSTKLKDLELAFQHQKTQNRVTLFEKHKSHQSIQTNTEQNFVPIIMPIDTNLIGQIVSLRDFLIQSLLSCYLQVFQKSFSSQKPLSTSLTTFKNHLSLHHTPQTSLLLFVHSGLQKIIKLYCPAMNYSREYLTVKDQFVRKVLVQCEQVTNKEQKLFRLLDLVNRLRYPILHDKPHITKGELKMVEIKILATLKKVFCNNK